MPVKRTHDTVEFQIHSDLRVFRYEGMTSFELAKLDELARQISGLRDVVQMRRRLEDEAPFPPSQSGKWFRTLSPSGRTAYYDTVKKAVRRACTTSANLGQSDPTATVLVEEWAPDGPAQDDTNRGWSMIGRATNGYYGGPQ